MAEALKLMYNAAFVADLTNRLKAVYPELNSAAFRKRFDTAEWKVAELKQRVNYIARTLHDFLPTDFSAAIDILIPVSQQYTPGYLPIFFPEFVALYGERDWKTSMRALEVFTCTSSAEFAIRGFIRREPVRTMKQMMAWTKHPNHHVRRLSSEGCRPRLPWGEQLKDFIRDPSPVLPILEALKEDESLYVRKSVANHLNDISKDHPELLLRIAKAWKGKNADTDWILKHALRTLLKKGNKEAMHLFGFDQKTRVVIHNFSLTSRKLSIGDRLGFSFQVEVAEKKPSTIRLAYAVDFRKSAGHTTNKVFHLSEKEMAPGKHAFSRSHRFADLSTRVHHPGEHAITILVNGIPHITEKFVLLRK